MFSKKVFSLSGSACNVHVHVHVMYMSCTCTCHVHVQLYMYMYETGRMHTTLKRAQQVYTLCSFLPPCACWPVLYINAHTPKV